MHFWKLVTPILGPDYFVMSKSYKSVFTLLPANRLTGLPQFIIRMMYFLKVFPQLVRWIFWNSNLILTTLNAVLSQCSQLLPRVTKVPSILWLLYKLWHLKLVYSQEKPHWLGNRLGLSLPPPLCGSGPPGCTPAYTGSHVRLFLAVDYVMCVSLKIAVYMTDICLHSLTCSPAPLVFAGSSDDVIWEGFFANKTGGRNTIFIV